MTISEIANTHNGRKFRRPGGSNMWFNHNKQLTCSLGVTSLSIDALGAEDWGFEVPPSEPMGFVEMVKQLEGSPKTKIAWNPRYGKNMPIHYNLMLKTRGASFPIDLEDVMSNDWRVEG